MTETRETPRLETWMAIYRESLAEAHGEKPDEYCWPLSELDVVCSRMKEAFRRGTYNHDGLAFRKTCRRFGIKSTRTAIEGYLAGRTACWRGDDRAQPSSRQHGDSVG